MADGFREEYALATQRAAASLGRSGWELVWSRVTRHAAAELAEPDADALAVLRRLERLIDWYRRTTTDPVRLFGSLEVQEAVSCGVYRPRPPQASGEDRRGWSAGARRIRRHPRLARHRTGSSPRRACASSWTTPTRRARPARSAFEGWPVHAGAAQHAPEFQARRHQHRRLRPWRSGVDLYTCPHAWATDSAPELWSGRRSLSFILPGTA